MGVPLISGGHGLFEKAMGILHFTISQRLLPTSTGLRQLKTPQAIIKKNVSHSYSYHNNCCNRHM